MSISPERNGPKLMPSAESPRSKITSTVRLTAVSRPQNSAASRAMYAAVGRPRRPRRGAATLQRT